METRNIKFAGNVGDQISIFPALRQYYRLFEKKIVMYLWLNRPAAYYLDAPHPVKNSSGVKVMLNEKMFDLIRPLMLEQDFIEDVKVWEGEKIDLDFDIMYERIINKPYGSINRWPFYAYPNLSKGADLSKVWINAPRETMQYAGKIIVNRTERYLNPLCHYFFLKNYKEEIIFTGTKHEHELFCKEWMFEVPHYEAPNFLELAQVIQQCKFYLGNQSVGFQIAEGLKVPRILEVCLPYPNVIPIGLDAFDFHQQIGLEDAFYYLIEKYKK